MIEGKKIGRNTSLNIERSSKRETAVPIEIYMRPKEIKWDNEIECAQTGTKKVLDNEFLISTDIRDGYIPVVPLDAEKSEQEPEVEGRKDISKVLVRHAESPGDLTPMHLKRDPRHFSS